MMQASVKDQGNFGHNGCFTWFRVQVTVIFSVTGTATGAFFVA